MRLLPVAHRLIAEHPLADEGKLADQGIDRSYRGLRGTRVLTTAALRRAFDLIVNTVTPARINKKADG